MTAPDDDLIPPRPRGRPLRKFDGDGFDDAGSSHVCGECPKHNVREWCLVRAEQRSRKSPACKYGVALISAANQRRRREARK